MIPITYGRTSNNTNGLTRSFLVMLHAMLAISGFLRKIMRYNHSQREQLERHLVIIYINLAAMVQCNVTAVHYQLFVVAVQLIVKTSQHSLCYN